MIRIRLLHESKVVKQITSRVHEGIVLEQIKKYTDPFDTIQIIEGRLSENSIDILQHVAKRIIPAAMSAGMAVARRTDRNAAQDVVQTEDIGTIGTVGTIPASGASSMTKKTQFSKPGGTTDVKFNAKGQLELDHGDELDDESKSILKKAGVEIAEAAATDLQSILDQYSDSYAAFKNGDDLTDNPDFYDALFDFYVDSGEMPYGVAKARDGDPVNWITDRLNEFEPMGESFDDDEDEFAASPADQGSADKNIIMQLRKANDYEKPTKLELADGSTFTIGNKTAKMMLDQFEKMRPDGKELMQRTLNTEEGFRELLNYFNERPVVTESAVGYASMLSVMKAVDAGHDATFDLAGEQITLDYNEARFLSGRYKAYLKAGRQEEFLKYMENPRTFDLVMKQLRTLIDKQKNFKGSVQGERGVEEDAPFAAQAIAGAGLGALAGVGGFMFGAIFGPLGSIAGAGIAAAHGARGGVLAIDAIWDKVVQLFGNEEEAKAFAQAHLAAAQAHQPHFEYEGKTYKVMVKPNEVQKAANELNKVAESKELTEKLRLVASHGTGAKTAKVYRDEEWQEFRVKFYTDGKHEGEDADYHTDSKDDANDTAKHEVERGWGTAKESYYCRLSKERKLIPEGYKKTNKGYITRRK